MATTEYTDQWYSGIKPGTGAGTLKCIYGSIEIGTALTVNSVIHFCTAPVGFTPLYGWLVGDDLDTGTEALEIDVGITGDTTKYLNSGVITGDTIANEKITVGIKIPLQEDLMLVKPTAFTSDTDIIGTITAAANAGGTGTLTLMMFGLQDDPRVS
jgi:hypothetical protein